MDDAFAILGLDRRFDLTPAEVSAAHLRAVARLHPDRATDEVERDRMMRAAAAAGAAKQRLLSDQFRAEELLEFLGARSFLAEPLSPAFLMETLELREEVEAACEGGDAVTVDAVASRVGESLAGERASLAAALAAALAARQGAARSASADDGSSRAARDAASALVRMRYLARMADRLRGDP